MTRHRTADLEPTSFGGRYTLVRRLAVGGMAEIYLARQAAMAGFEKEVVIKRLRAELADDPRIVEMFLDEARIGALLNHPNIVHVYDVDEHDGIPYIAMEYIVGEELNELCRRGISHGKFLPLEHAVELMRQAAAGLGYFHSKRGPEGTALASQPLDIVHLDISPTNLLVTQDGFLKVIDFGIARARGQRAQEGVIPGKLSYMSPEQANRKTVDHRSDVFSLGIVLYEITVGKRLYRGPAVDVVEKLIAGKVEPPTFVRRNFPPALEAIVMRTLERHPDDRYQTAYDLADDLESFLRDERLHSGPVRIARYLDMLSIASGGQRRPELVSEAESREAGEDLDFDQQAFDGYVAAEGAPGPEQAPEWEDSEQSEADIARALGMELAELRHLRTPVPTKPSGVQVTRPPDVVGGGDDGDVGEAAAGASIAPLPKRRAVTGESDDDDADFEGETTIDPASQAAASASALAKVPADHGDRGDAQDVEIDTKPREKVDAASVAENPPSHSAVAKVEPLAMVEKARRAGTSGSFGTIPATPPAAPPNPPAKAPAAAARAAIAPVAAPAPAMARPMVGAGLLARSNTNRLPWILAIVFGLVVIALLYYIYTHRS